MHKRILLITGAMLMAATSLFSHAPGLSVATLRLDEQGLTATIEVAADDARSLEPLAVGRQGLIVHVDDRRVEATERTAERAQINGTEAVRFRYQFPLGAPWARLRVESQMMDRLPSGHRQMATMQYGDREPFLERLLDTRNRSFEIDLAEIPESSSAWTSFPRFLVLGVEHILLGYDQLLFLVGLLVASESLRSAVKWVTAFTVAHSVTLALVILGIVAVPARIVEPVIAASIVWVGIENLRGGNLDRRWLLVFAFGLVHGLGFAAALKELVVGSSLATTLLGFNLGVELGQIAIVLVAIPLIRLAWRRPWVGVRCYQAASVLLVLAGTYWLAERTLFG